MIQLVYNICGTMILVSVEAPTVRQLNPSMLRFRAYFAELAPYVALPLEDSWFLTVEVLNSAIRTTTQAGVLTIHYVQGSLFQNYQSQYHNCFWTIKQYLN